MTWKLYLLVILVVISTAMLGLRQKRQSREAAVLGIHEGKPVL